MSRPASHYCRIWFYLLEAAGPGVQLVNAREARNMPGRPKADQRGSAWRANAPSGACCVPRLSRPPGSACCGTHTRLRTDLTQERTRYYARPEKLLEDALIKVSAVASTKHQAGPRHDRGADRRRAQPRELGDLARGGQRRSGQALVEDGRRRCAERGQPGRPERLVADLRHAHRRDPGAQAGRRGARARMMNDGGHLREQPVVRHVAD